jgi:hypothetical protein
MKGQCMRGTVLAPAALAAICIATVFSDPGAAHPRLVPIHQPFGSVLAIDVYGITDHEDITGSVTESTGAVRGYATQNHFGSWDIFDYIGASETRPRGIDTRRNVTGYAPESGLTTGLEFRRIHDPNAGVYPILRGKKNPQPLDGVVQQITSHDRFVGDYWHMVNGNAVATGYYGDRTRYRGDLTLPFNTTETHPRGINNSGEVVGYFADDNRGGAVRGFILKDGTATAVDYPDPAAAAVLLEGVNDSGLIVGAWVNSDASKEHAFLFDPATNAFQPIDVPGATFAAANGINNKGVATVSSDVGIFLYCPSRKHCSKLAAGRDIPLAEHWMEAPHPPQRMICRAGCLRQPDVLTPVPAALSSLKWKTTWQLERRLRIKP